MDESQICPLSSTRYGRPSRPYRVPRGSEIERAEWVEIELEVGLRLLKNGGSHYVEETGVRKGYVVAEEVLDASEAGCEARCCAGKHEVSFRLWTHPTSAGQAVYPSTRSGPQFPDTLVPHSSCASHTADHAPSLPLFPPPPKLPESTMVAAPSTTLSEWPLPPIRLPLRLPGLSPRWGRPQGREGGQMLDRNWSKSCLIFHSVMKVFGFVGVHAKGVKNAYVSNVALSSIRRRRVLPLDFR